MLADTTIEYCKTEDDQIEADPALVSEDDSVMRSESCIHSRNRHHYYSDK